MSTTCTPLRYPGGKTVYAELISSIIDLNNLEDVTLVEPYAGGAGASIKLLLTGKVKKLILNDLDVSIYAFWWAVLNSTQALIEQIMNVPLSIDEWKRQRIVYRRKDIKDLVALGFSTLYMNRCNRSGILSANPIGGIGQCGAYKMDARFNREGLIKKIEDIARCRRSIVLRNNTCERLLISLQRRKKTDDLLVYLDPPYYQKGPCLYLNHYSPDDHKKLSEIILRCKFNWLLSYDCHDEIRMLYRDVPQYKSNLRYTIVGNECASELIATHLKVPAVLKRFKARS